MLINCTTKGCLQSTNAKLDKDTNEVICESCGNPIRNITQFTKKALMGMGQFLRNKKKQPFMSLCQKCNESRSLYVKDDKAFCEKCDTQVHITSAFMVGLKQYLKNKDE